MEFVDTHCHIHEIIGTTGVAGKWHKAGVADIEAVIKEAANSDVTRLICVGCTLEDSELAVDFVRDRANCWASIGIHPHEAAQYVDDQNALDCFAALAMKPKVVAVGECGLDYFYEHSPKEAQAKILRFQLELAQKHNLPMVFHVREAFDDFWPIFDEFKNIRGVIHSFTADSAVLTEILKRNLFVGLNGIMTFTKDAQQLTAAKAVPLERLVLETDAPFLTPAPYRGTICEPKHVRVTAQFLADLRGENLDQIARMTTQNAKSLFGVS